MKGDIFEATLKTSKHVSGESRLVKEYIYVFPFSVSQWSMRVSLGMGVGLPRSLFKLPLCTP